VDDLVGLSSVSPQSFDDYIAKKGFPVKRRSLTDNNMGYTFYGSPEVKDSVVVNRSINLYKSGDTWYVALHTSSEDEYISGRSRLKKMNLVCDGHHETSDKAPMLFQKKAITVQATVDSEENEEGYTFLFARKEIPDPSNIRYAEDLLKFDSHEYLVACFGENNVKKDVYVFSETESKKCSILFPNSNEQAVFVWEDETNYRKLSYIIISGTFYSRWRSLQW